MENKEQERNEQMGGLAGLGAYACHDHSRRRDNVRRSVCRNAETQHHLLRIREVQVRITEG